MERIGTLFTARPRSRTLFCRAYGVLLSIKVGIWSFFAIVFANLLLGQKCSALSRLYVSKYIWENGFKTQFLEEIAKIKVGPCTQWDNFVGPVMYVPQAISVVVDLN